MYASMDGVIIAPAVDLVQREGRLESMNGAPHGSLHSRPDLLGLPFEIRRRIFEFILQAPEDIPFPPKKGFAPMEVIKSSLFQPICFQSAAAGMTDRQDADRRTNHSLKSLLICRQIYHEMRTLVFELNVVELPAPFRSNVTATLRFIEQLTRIQRVAIRGLSVQLLASATEGWVLRRILRLVAGLEESEVPACPITECDNGRDRVEQQCQSSSTANGLQDLKVQLTARDLMLPSAESVSGLLHLLATGSCSFSSTAPPPLHSRRTWVSDGLIHLKSLKRLIIEVNMSSTTAIGISLSDRDRFERTIAQVAPWCGDVNFKWTVEGEADADFENHEWIDLLWLNHTVVRSSGYSHKLTESA